MKPGFWLLLVLWPLVGISDEAALTDMLGRIRHTGSTEFSYQETRKLELASSPINAQGTMLSGEDGSLIKVQLQPKRVIMVSTEQRLLYWDAEQKQRHSATVGQAGSAAEQIGLFRSILQGQIEDLRSNYEISTEKNGKLWSLRMTAKQPLSDEDVASILVSGDDEGNKRHVLITQADGESTEYRMVKTMEGPEVDKTIQRLMLEVTGE